VHRATGENDAARRRRFPAPADRETPRNSAKLCDERRRKKVLTCVLRPSGDRDGAGDWSPLLSLFPSFATSRREEARSARVAKMFCEIERTPLRFDFCARNLKRLDKTRSGFEKTCAVFFVFAISRPSHLVHPALDRASSANVARTGGVVGAAGTGSRQPPPWRVMPFAGLARHASTRLGGAPRCHSTAHTTLREQNSVLTSFSEGNLGRYTVESKRLPMVSNTPDRARPSGRRQRRSPSGIRAPSEQFANLLQ
jgi:hypothetical protein